MTDLMVTQAISEEQLLRLAAAAEQGSEHPLGEAIVESAKTRKLELPKLSDFTAVSGFGISANIEGQTFS